MTDNKATLFDFTSDTDKKTDWRSESIINQDMFLEVLRKLP